MSEPVAAYGTPEITLEKILDMPTWLAMEQYGLEFKSTGLYIQDRLVAEWIFDDNDDSEEETGDPPSYKISHYSPYEETEESLYVGQSYYVSDI